MQYIHIENFDLPQLQPYQRMKAPLAEHQESFIADSPKVVSTLLESGIEAYSLLATQAYYHTHQQYLEQFPIERAYIAPKSLMESIVGHRLHHNVMMHAKKPAPTPLEELNDEIVMLTEISNSDNIGAIARSGAGLGVKSYLLPKQGPHPYARRAVRVSMGYMGHLQYHLYEQIEETILALKKRGYTIFAAEVTPNATPLSHVKSPKKWVLLMGHEQNGISKEILSLCDEVLSIEMEQGVKSFNVAIASSIMMYQLKHA